MSIRLTGTAWKDSCRLFSTMAAAVTAICGALKAFKDLADGEANWWHIPFCFFVAGVLIWCAYIFGVKRPEQSKLVTKHGEPSGAIKVWKYSDFERSMAAICAVLILILGLAGYFWFSNALVFSKDDFGILILKLGGDSGDTTDIRLRNAINDQLSLESSSYGIKVHLLGAIGAFGMALCVYFWKR